MWFLFVCLFVCFKEGWFLSMVPKSFLANGVSVGQNWCMRLLYCVVGMVYYSRSSVVVMLPVWQVQSSD